MPTALPSGAHTSTVNSGTLTVSGTLSGAGSVTKGAHDGTLLLSAANTHSGGTAIADRQSALNPLRIAHGSALGSGSLTVGSGGNNDRSRLELTGNITVNNTITSLTSRNNDYASFLNVSGTNAITKSVAGGGGGNRTTFQSDAGRMTFSGLITTRQLNLRGAGSGVLSGEVRLQTGYGLVKMDAGTWELQGQGTYPGNTTVSGGTLAVGVNNGIGKGLLVLNGGTLGVCNGGPRALTNTASVTASSALSTAGGDLTLSGALGGSAALAKQGAGTLTLTGDSGYSGVLTVSQGTLLVNNAAGSGTGSGTVSVGADAALGGTGTLQGAVALAAGASLLPGGAGAVGTLTVGTALELNGCTLTVDASESGAHDAVALSGASPAGVLTLNGANTLALNLLDLGLVAGTYTLLSYSSLAGSGSFELDKSYPNTVLNVGATNVTLTVSGIGVGQKLTWQGNGTDNRWDVGVSALWSDGAGAVVFTDTARAYFDDAGSIAPAVDLVETVRPALVVVSNSLSAYTFSGAGGIAGAGSFRKQGAGSLTVACANTYSGETLVSGGMLAYGIDHALGNGAVTVQGAGATLNVGSYTDTVGTVTLDGGAQLTGTTGALATEESFELKNGLVSASLAGGGAVHKSTSATVTLAGANAYTGGTFLAGGTLAANHSLALGAGRLTYNGGVRLVPGSGVVLTNAIVIGANAGSVGRGLIESASGTATVSGPIEVLNGALAGGHFAALSGSILQLLGPITSPDVRIVQRDGTCVFAGGGAYPSLSVTGTLLLGADNGVATNALLDLGTSGNGVLDLNGKSQQLNGLTKSNGSTTARVTNSEPNTVTLTLAVGAGSAQVFSGTIGGAVALVKRGDGAQTLSGTNSFRGPTAVEAGTLTLSATGRLGAGCTNVAVSAGTLVLQQAAALDPETTLAVTAGGGARVWLDADVTVGYLLVDGRRRYANTYGAAGSGAQVIDNTLFSGAGVLTVRLGSGGTTVLLK